MSRFEVSQWDGGDGNRMDSNGGIDNPAMDSVELNVHGLYERNSVTHHNNGGELKRKSSYGFTHITR